MTLSELCKTEVIYRLASRGRRTKEVSIVGVLLLVSGRLDIAYGLEVYSRIPTSSVVCSLELHMLSTPSVAKPQGTIRASSTVEYHVSSTVLRRNLLRNPLSEDTNIPWRGRDGQGLGSPSYKHVYMLYDPDT